MFAVLSFAATEYSDKFVGKMKTPSLFQNDEVPIFAG
jgi:hypothetical protein